MNPSVSKQSPKGLHLKAIWMLLIANFLWGLSFPAIKALTQVHALLLPGSGNWFVTSMTVGPRFLLATVLLLCWKGAALLRSTPAEWRQGLILGLFASGGMLFQNDGLQFTDASVSAFLTQFYAILIPLWSAFVHRKNPGARVWIACALVLLGSSILGRFDWRYLTLGRGELETLLSSFFFMGQILTLDLESFKGNRGLNITFVMILVQLCVFGLMVCGVAPSASAVLVLCTNVPWVVLTLILTVFCTLGAFLLMNAWQRFISSIEAGLIYCVEPIFGSLMALSLPTLISAWAGISYFNEQASWHLLLGGALITLANLWLQIGLSRERKDGAPEARLEQQS